MPGSPIIIVTTSWDDGHPLDLKLADLLERLGIRGTFYLPLNNGERKVMETAAMVELSRRYEVGGHTRNHIDLRHLPDQAIDEEVGVAKRDLEDVIRMPVNAFSYPRGKHNPRVRKAVRKAGFTCGRTTKEWSLDLARDPFQLPTTLQAFPHSAWIRFRHAITTHNTQGVRRAFGRASTQTWTELARQLFYETLENGGVWHLWGHSWELEEYGLWDDLAELLKSVSGHSQVKYLSNFETVKLTARQGDGLNLQESAPRVRKTVLPEARS